MGPDVVELVMEVEAQFGLEVPDWERLPDILERETGRRRERLTSAASFVDDLGMD